MNKKQNKIRKIFTEDLPHKNKNVDWVRSFESQCDLPFEYDGIIGILKLIKYNAKNGKIEVEYKGEIQESLLTTLVASNLTYIIGIRSRKYKYNIGDIIDGKIKITKQFRKINNCNQVIKSYEYECLKCGNKDSITQGMISLGCSCNVCGKHFNKVMYGVNSLADTNPEVIQYLANKEDAKKYSKGTHKKIKWICKDCGQNKMLSPYTFIENGIMCNRCSDGKSMPNKIMFSILQQLLENNFENEKLFKWCKFNKYNSDKKQIGYYDFYFELNGNKYIIEMDGELGHGRDTTYSSSEETIYIDNMKDELAKEHNIEVIRIQCPNNIDIIKQNILNSKLSTIFDLTIIKWNECLKYSSSSLVITAINYYNNGMVVSEIEKLMKISDTTVRKYLKCGKEMGMCDYGTEEGNKRQTEINSNYKRKIYSKEVICLENGYRYGSLRECEENSIKDFNTLLQVSGICEVCNGKRKSHKDYHFKYVQDLTEEEKIKYNINITNNKTQLSV